MLRLGFYNYLYKSLDMMDGDKDIFGLACTREQRCRDLNDV